MKKLYHKEYIGFIYFMLIFMIIIYNFPCLVENNVLNKYVFIALMLLMFLYGKTDLLDKWPI